MTKLLVTSAAERDYAEVMEWYLKQSTTAAERFDAEFVQALESIEQTPQRFPSCDERHRFLLMRHFPYQVVYRQQADHWAVIAVVHTARSARAWQGR